MLLFGPPKTSKLHAKHDLEGLIKARLYWHEKVLEQQAAENYGECVAKREIRQFRGSRPVRTDLAVAAVVLAQEKLDRAATKEAEVVAAIGSFGDTRVIEPLINALRDSGAVEDPYWSYIASAAETGLSKVGSPAVEPLISRLGDKDSRVRRGAVMTLGKIGDARAVQPLISALRDKDRKVRSAAAMMLSKIGGTRAVKALIRALHDEYRKADFEERNEITRALEKLGVAEAD
jgi:HEAT repeat protein